jgi:hypothetical protein
MVEDDELFGNNEDILVLENSNDWNAHSISETLHNIKNTQ